MKLVTEKAVHHRNTIQNIGYVGSGICAKCHAAVASDYALTPMGQSMATPSYRPELQKIAGPVTVFDENSDRYFQVWRQGDEFYQSEFARGPSGRELFRHSEKIAYAVGAGVTGVSYIVRRGDYLFQAPLSYYSGSGKWALSPGYAQSSLGFARPMLATCVSCHSGRPQPAAQDTGRYENPAFQELAIGCESCHGPGELHVQARLKNAPRSGKDTSIVNPANLSSWLADNICMGCHEFGDARVLQAGKTFGNFHPGAPLETTLAIFKIPLRGRAGGAAPLLDYYSSMILSKCYRASGGRLGCLTCHDPHHVRTQRDRAAYYRAKCLQCHTEKSCRLTLSERQNTTPADNCEACHMPRRRVQGFSHAMVTSHRIVSGEGEPYPEDTIRQERIPGTGLILLDSPRGDENVTVSPFVLLRAYHDIVTKYPKESAYRQRYGRLLNLLAKTKPSDPVVLSNLAHRELMAGTPEGEERASLYLQRAVAAGSASVSDYVILAELLVRHGQDREAASILKQAMGLAPYNPLLYQDLAIAYWFAGNYKACSGTVKQGINLFPGDIVQRSMLKRCQEKLGDLN